MTVEKMTAVDTFIARVERMGIAPQGYTEVQVLPYRRSKRTAGGIALEWNVCLWKEHGSSGDKHGLFVAERVDSRLAHLIADALRIVLAARKDTP